LLDEPTANVDYHGRAEIWKMLNSLKDDGAALLVSTHVLTEAARYCDRLMILSEGRTVAYDTVAELCRQGDNLPGAGIGGLYLHLTEPDDRV
jgi:ABC-2 type transport system ATP-binding protein